MSRTLALESVSKRFGRGPQVLDGLTLHLEAGSTLALLGQSGSGKSTLLRIVAGLEEPDAGRVSLGEAVVNAPRSRVPAHLRRVGLVFQDLELWPHRTTAENIAFGLPGRPRGRAALEHPRVRALAQRLGIEGVLARRPESLSGGERQRAALARTLAPEPDVLLLDEPLASLDARRRADLISFLAAVSRDGGPTTLLVTHDPGEALALGERVAVLSAGRIAEVGPGQSLYAHPRTLAAAQALGPANLVPATRETQGWRTPLGLLPAARHDDATARVVLVRPENLVLEAAGTAGVEARVRASWPRTSDFGVELDVGGQALEARSRTAPEAGQLLRLSVSGPVVGLEPEGAHQRKGTAA